jgi:hypothetical protein
MMIGAVCSVQANLAEWIKTELNSSVVQAVADLKDPWLLSNADALLEEWQSMATESEDCDVDKIRQARAASRDSYGECNTVNETIDTVVALAWSVLFNGFRLPPQRWKQPSNRYGILVHRLSRGPRLPSLAFQV